MPCCLFLIDDFLFQSTLPREERRAASQGTGHASDISIHAPTRGATLSLLMWHVSRRFQSTLPREERLCRRCFSLKPSISIHAPTRGATLPSLSDIALCIFQSTLPREERHRPIFSAISLIVFQSTLPREERLPPDRLDRLSQPHFNPRSHERSDVRAYVDTKAQANFNPRSHERSDKVHVVSSDVFTISIHAPTRGATHMVVTFKLTTSEFQSTLPREERLNGSGSCAITFNFNPRSHERSDQERRLCGVYDGISIHAPTRGATCLSSPFSGTS